MLPFLLMFASSFALALITYRYMPGSSIRLLYFPSQQNEGLSEENTSSPQRSKIFMENFFTQISQPCKQKKSLVPSLLGVNASGIEKSQRGKTLLARLAVWRKETCATAQKRRRRNFVFMPSVLQSKVNFSPLEKKENQNKEWKQIVLSALCA